MRLSYLNVIVIRVFIPDFLNSLLQLWGNNPWPLDPKNGTYKI
jgi:hypothetical protein